MRYYPPRFLFRRYELLKRLKSGSAFLEIGPGSLNLTRDLAERFDIGVLVDYNPQTANVFHELDPCLKSKLSLVLCNFFLYNTEHLFSSIIACEVMEHIQDDKAFLKKAYEMLEDGGQLALSVPARMKYWSIHDEGVGHLRRYEKTDLEILLRDVGFSDIEIASYGFPFLGVLRIPRILLARIQASRNSRMTRDEQTKESAFSQYKIMGKYLGIMCNKYTIMPLSMFSSIYNHMDLSNGYIATASKACDNSKSVRIRQIY